MKRCRFGEPDAERPLIVGGNGVLRYLSGHIEDIAPARLSVQERANLAKISLSGLSISQGNRRLRPLVAGVSGIIANGLKYRHDAEEAGIEIPQSPANRSTGDIDANR
jgi:hypothetical protein